jgi:hypothetical protein
LVIPKECFHYKYTEGHDEKDQKQTTCYAPSTAAGLAWLLVEVELGLVLASTNRRATLLARVAPSLLGSATYLIAASD